MSEQLKPCPFCGEKPAIFDNRIYCPYYECQIGGDPSDVPTFTVGAWNTRPIEDVRRAELQQVRDALRRFADINLTATSWNDKKLVFDILNARKVLKGGKK